MTETTVKLLGIKATKTKTDAMLDTKRQRANVLSALIESALEKQRERETAG